MIIFTSDHNIKDYMCAIHCEKYLFYEFNLSSPIEMGIPLTEFIPNADYVPLEFTMTQDYDAMYVNMILNSHSSMLTLVRIMNLVFDNPDAVIIIYTSPSEARDTIAESLMKLIQQRYGYACQIINDLDDVFYIDRNVTFSTSGLMMYDADMATFRMAGVFGQPSLEEE